jgi:hypothetical protein
MKQITNLNDFDTYDNRGYVYYKKFCLPYSLPLQNKKGRRLGVGEGLNDLDRQILFNIERRIQTEALVDIWEGQVPDICVLFASIIEAGFGAKVLPKVIDKGMLLDSNVSRDAKKLLQDRKKDKIETKKKQLRLQLGQDN